MGHNKDLEKIQKTRGNYENMQNIVDVGNCIGLLGTDFRSSHILSLSLMKHLYKKEDMPRIV